MTLNKSVDEKITLTRSTSMNIRTTTSAISMRLCLDLMKLAVSLKKYFLKLVRKIYCSVWFKKDNVHDLDVWFSQG
jgi:hypothetical protein